MKSKKMGKLIFTHFFTRIFAKKAPNASLTSENVRWQYEALTTNEWNNLRKSFAGDKVSEISEKETLDIFEEL